MSIDRRVTALAAILGASIALAQPAPRVTLVARAPDPYQVLIRDGVRARASAFRRCFERALRSDPALVGRTDALRFRVLPSGRVRAIEVRLVPRSAVIERCMTGVVERMVLPPHPGGPIEVDYPISNDR